MRSPFVTRLIDLALEEDAGHGDLTSRAIFPEGHRSAAVIEAGEPLVATGLDVAAQVFARVDSTLRVQRHVADGARVRAGRRLMTVRGGTVSLLTAERTALNFLQRLSGVATLARRYADAVAGTGVRVVDTRKTTPGWRVIEKAAVRAGGCANHRASLGEHILIKDNHLAAAGSVRAAVARARAQAPHLARVQVEVDTLAQLRAALRAGADAVLLDNMPPALVRQAVAIVAGRAVVEVSGGVTLQTLREFALPGVDVISVGALTHSAPAVDIGMRLLVPGRARR